MTRGPRPVLVLVLAALMLGTSIVPAAAQIEPLPGDGDQSPLLLPPEVCAFFIALFGEAPLLCAPIEDGEAPPTTAPDEAPPTTPAPESPESPPATAAAPPAMGGGTAAPSAPSRPVPTTADPTAAGPAPTRSLPPVRRVLTTIGEGFTLPAWLVGIAVLVLAGYVGATSAPGRKSDGSAG